MNTHFSTTRKLAAAWIMLVLATASAMAARGGAYLPITGPTPLRFEATMPRTFALSHSKSAEQVAKADDAKSTIVPADAGTNTPPQTSTASTTEPNPTDPQTISIGESMAPVPTATYLPAGEMPLVTPQMLAEYFRPFPGATNGAGVSVSLPIQVGFTPPMEKPPATSRATYKVQ